MADDAFQAPGIKFGKEPAKAEDESETLMFGFWFFLMSDAILFALVFATYIINIHRTFDGPTTHQLYDITSIFAQTMCLLFSSFTFGMASLALKYGHSKERIFGWMLVTMLLGLAFLGLEASDFVTMVGMGGVAERNGFLSGFWDLVPLHGLHVTVGIIWMLCLAVQVKRFGLDHWSRLGIRRLALFWHFLDIVWIAIFSVVYLSGLM